MPVVKRASQAGGSRKKEEGETSPVRGAGRDDDEVPAGVDPDELWYIHGKAYDLTEYMKTHPGGSEALATCSGRDITALFESYHSFNMSKPRAVLAKMKPVPLPPSVLASHVMDLSNGNWWTDPKTGKADAFWRTLIERCDKVLNSEEVGGKTMGWGRFLLAWLGILVQPVIYYYGYLSPVESIRFLSALLLAVTNTFNSGTAHDAGHWAVSRIKWINNSMYVGSSLLWANVGVWQVMHQVHHMETNDEEEDPDMHHFVPFLRYTTDTPWNWKMAYQIYRAYCYVHWSLVTAGMLILHPARVMIVGRITKTGPRLGLAKRDWHRRAMLVVHWLAFVYCMLILPFRLHLPRAYWAFSLYMHTSGLFYGILSQVSHFNKDCVEAAKKNTSWAQRQVETSANFGVHSVFWNLMSGSTNVQIEHHLFPQVCTAKLVYLAPTVKETCQEFGVDYKEFPGMRGILASTHESMRSVAYDECHVTIKANRQ